MTVCTCPKESCWEFLLSWYEQDRRRIWPLASSLRLWGVYTACSGMNGVYCFEYTWENFLLYHDDCYHIA